MLVRESIAFQKKKDPKEALGVSATFHADDILFYDHRAIRDAVRAKNIFQNLKYPEKQILKCFNKFDGGEIGIKQDNEDYYSLIEIYKKGYRYIDFKGIILDIDKKINKIKKL